MLKVGLTGGIGSGKTTVAHIFEVLGIPVFYADSAARKLMNESAELKASIIEVFGERAYDNGRLDRKFLSAEVFNKNGRLQILNSLVHPATIKNAEAWFKKQNAPYVIKEAALLFESGSNTMLDYVIGVQSPVTLSVQRAVQRDNISKEEVYARIDKQMDEAEKLRLCNYVIVNDEQEMLIPQVLALHEKFLKLAAKTS